MDQVLDGGKQNNSQFGTATLPGSFSSINYVGWKNKVQTQNILIFSVCVQQPVLPSLPALRSITGTRQQEETFF